MNQPKPAADTSSSSSPEMPQLHVGTAQPTADARPDPLDPDDDADEAFLITKRRLDRVVLLAATVGAQSIRDPRFGDAMEWLTRPQRIFNGAIPIEAAQERDNLMRCLILHLLVGETDANPGDLDRLRGPIE